QSLAGAPKLAGPGPSFYCYALEELPEVATRELAAYFSDTSLEALLPYRHGRQEYLDEIEVSFTPLKPQQEKKRKRDEDEPEGWALKASGLNLSARANEGKLLRADRREREVNAVLNVLAAERSNSILLID